MARITSRPTDEEEDIMDEVDDDEELEERTSAPAVSDSRRRRMLKRGEVPAAVVPTRKDRATPSQRPEQEKRRNFVVRFFQGIVTYFQETRSELGKVTWLTREDTLRLAYIVIIVTAVSAIFLGTVGFIFGLLTQALASIESTTIAGAITIGLIVIVAGAWLLRDRLFSRFE